MLSQLLKTLGLWGVVRPLVVSLADGRIACLKYLISRSMWKIYYLSGEGVLRVASVSYYGSSCVCLKSCIITCEGQQIKFRILKENVSKKTFLTCVNDFRARKNVSKVTPYPLGGSL